MLITADIKMQIEAIKNPKSLFVLDFGETVLLTDGTKGPYIKKEDALINLEIIKHTELVNDDFNPDSIELTKVTRTRHLIVTSSGKVACRFDTEDGEYIWVRNDWLKEYGNAFSYATEKSKKASIPIGINGELLGVILSIHVGDINS